jgi:hypothetical protein
MRNGEEKGGNVKEKTEMGSIKGNRERKCKNIKRGENKFTLKKECAEE